jgi:exopolyphosphatase/guanosine-5'-triphosphate,3'-diphosphate pyrophosphatase
MQLSRRLFNLLASQYHLSARLELFLTLASLLHDTGQFVEMSGHHKHSLYLITHSNLFGLGARDIKLIAVIARYHRKALPSVTHPEFSALDRDSRMAVLKLAAILRVCDALDRRHLHGSLDIAFARRERELVITMQKQSDISIEQLALKDKANLFEQVYGMSVVLRRADGIEGAEDETV